MHRGNLLKAGLSLKKYWREIERIGRGNFLLAVNPQSAMSGYERDEKHVPYSPPVPTGRMIEAAGVPIGE